MLTRKEWLIKQITQSDSRPPSKLVAKHVKMAASPFFFFRGSAPLFYQDIADGKLEIPNELENCPKTMIMGDCHTSNFGFFTEEGSHNDHVIFGPNDFDDACVGMAAWDISRYLTSLVLCTKHCALLTNKTTNSVFPDQSKLQGKISVDESQLHRAMEQFLDGYCITLQRIVESPPARNNAIDSFPKPHILNKRYIKACDRACDGDAFYTASSLAKFVDFDQTPLDFIKDDSKFEQLDPIEIARIKDAISPYVDDSILSVVKRLDAGTGSLNLPRYYLLVAPERADRSSAPLSHIVEVKQQLPASPLKNFSKLSPINTLNPAHLTVVCQRRMQRRADLVLDDIYWNERHWLIRSRHHAKVGIQPEHIAIGKKAVVKNGFAQYAHTCGQALALAHSRSDKRSTQFELSHLSAITKVATTLIESCLEYADSVVSDTELFRELIEDEKN